METLAKFVGSIIVGLIVFLALILIATIPVYYLWNWVGVDILGLKSITLIQAWGIMALSGCLFKSPFSNSSKKDK